MKYRIGDEVFVHGYVDEIRKDTIIIRNDGGYFATVAKETYLASGTVDVNVDDLVMQIFNGSIKGEDNEQHS